MVALRAAALTKIVIKEFRFGLILVKLIGAKDSNLKLHNNKNRSERSCDFLAKFFMNDTINVYTNLSVRFVKKRLLQSSNRVRPKVSFS